MRSILLAMAMVLSFGNSAGQSAPDAVKSERPVPDAEGLYRIGRGVSAPVPVFMPDPDLPEEARKKKVVVHSGSVRLVVNADGTVRDIHVVRSFAEGQKPKLRKAALTVDEMMLKTVGQYRFKPAMFEGKAVAVLMQVEINMNPF